MKFDLLVIGAGSGGLAMAQSAAGYGANTALIEAGRIGGTCVNVGCVPKKISWYAAQLAGSYRDAYAYGFTCENVTFDFKKFVSHRHEFINTLHQSYSDKLAKKDITYIKGRARFLDPHTVAVGDNKYSAEKMVIATGCYPDALTIPGAGFSINSNDFFELTTLPASVAIIGAGYIAVEFACMLNLLGAKVKILIRRDKLLRNFDAKVSENLMKKMQEDGIEILPFHEPSKILQNQGRLEIICGDQQPVVNADCVIAAIGRIPQTAELNLTAANVKTDEKGYIHADKYEATNVEHIYALGDVTGKKLLTPVAIAAGRKLAARLYGGIKDAYLDYTNIPTVIFSHPPIGSIGYSEEEALAKYGHKNIKIYETTFNPLFYALAQRKNTTYMKLITLLPDEKIIGCHLLGLNADEILQGFAVAVKMGATKSDFDNTIGIHPTSGEEFVTMISS
jgi:glutathione reductase (NADPH)